jgi:two-component system sensor histidine kinase CreC
LARRANCPIYASAASGSGFRFQALKEGSTIEVSLQQQDQHWVWRVRDHGPGVPDYALDRVFERFYSLPGPRRPGKSSGLGLCLVREVMTLHGGRVTVANVREGQQVLGCEACLILPFDGH